MCIRDRSYTANLAAFLTSERGLVWEFGENTEEVLYGPGKVCAWPSTMSPMRDVYPRAEFVAANSYGEFRSHLEDGTCDIIATDEYDAEHTMDMNAILCDFDLVALDTVVVMAYLPEQNGRLNKLVCSYAKSEMIRKVLLLWNGPHDNVPNTTCAHGWRSQQEGFHYASLTSPKREGRRGPEAELEVVVERKNTLLNRYRHGRRCATEAVLLQDDDIFHHRETLEAFSWMHAAAPAQVLGTYPERDWQVNAETGEYAYVFHPQKTKSKQYSFLLGQTSVVGRDTLSDFLSGCLLYTSPSPRD